jgi:hypothetical protein
MLLSSCVSSAAQVISSISVGLASPSARMDMASCFTAARSRMGMKALLSAFISNGGSPSWGRVQHEVDHGAMRAPARHEIHRREFWWAVGVSVEQALWLRTFSISTRLGSVVELVPIMVSGSVSSSRFPSMAIFRSRRSGGASTTNHAPRSASSGSARHAQLAKCRVAARQ